MGDDPKAFWDFFLKNVDELARDNSSKKVMDEVLDSLQRLDQRMYYHIGRHDLGQDILISLEGHFDLGPLVDRLMQSAPSLPGWGIVPILDSSLFFGKRNRELYPDDENG